MKIFTFDTQQWLPRPVGDVFAFFADARNLERLTPPWLCFQILTREPIDMREGTRINYRLRLHGLPLRWQSEITAWDPPHRFVDVQRRGPYRRWIHEHIFTPRDGGTAVRDLVQYALWGGWLLDCLLVRRDLNRIFAYRHEVLHRIFGSFRNRS